MNHGHLKERIMNGEYNNEKNGSSIGTFAMGLICGAALGAAAGLLLAPKPGVELRRQLAQTTERMRRRAASTVSQAADVVDDVVDRGTQAIQRGREAFDQIRGSGTRPDGGVGTSHA
jgi:gas vesicle protein